MLADDVIEAIKNAGERQIKELWTHSRSVVALAAVFGS